MKLIILSSLTLFSVSTFSQVSTEGLRDNFAQIAKYGSRQSGFEGITSFSDKNVKGSQFYYPGWTSGALIDKDNKSESDNLLFLYDKVRQQLFIKSKDSSTVLLADKDKIHGFNLVNNGTHNFEIASDYNPADKTDFYEVLIKNDNGYTLLKSTKTKFVKFDPADMVKMKSGDTYDEYADDINYYISYKHGALQAVKLKDNSIKKVLATDRIKVEDYVTNHFDAERNESFLVELITSLNQ